MFTFDLRTFLLASHYGKFNGSKWLDKVAGQGLKWFNPWTGRHKQHMCMQMEICCVIMTVNQIKGCWYVLFTACHLQQPFSPPPPLITPAPSFTPLGFTGIPNSYIIKNLS